MLLIRFDVLRRDAPFTLWATPGGSIEAGETDREAAEREIREELGLFLRLTGPVHTATDQFEHEGAFVENTDLFFVGQCPRDAPRLAGTTAAERNAMTGIRWWSVDEIDGASDTIFPADLGGVLRRLT